MRLMSLLLLFFGVSVGVVSGQTQDAANQAGEAVYAERCAKCHEGGVPRAANREGLRGLPPEAISLALTKGIMRTQAEGLTPAQIETLARLLGKPAAAAAPQAASNTCASNDPRDPRDPRSSFANPLERPRWNGWGADLSQSRFQPAGMAQLPANQVPQLKLKWAFGFPGATRAFAQPTVVGGRLFVGSAINTVYSLSADSGCQYWAFRTDAPVRTAVSIGPGTDPSRWVAYFGDQRANVYAVDALTGEQLWKRRADDFLGATMTGAPTLADGTLYVVTSSAEEVLGANAKYECCKFRGSVSALNAATGEVRWKSYTIPEEPKPVRKNKQGVQLWGPSGAGVWSSPAVDLAKGVVYVTTGDSYSDPAASTSDAFVAFDLETGKLLWSRQMTAGDAFTVDCGLPEALRTNCPEANGPDFDFGSSPILAQLPNGRRALIAGQKSGMVHGIDPDSGAILWQTRVGKGTALGGVQWGSAFDGSRVYVALSDVQPEPAKPGETGAQSTAFGVPMRLNAQAGGGLFALNPATGAVIWNTPHPGCGDRPGCSPAQSAAVTAIPGVVFSGGLDGHLRAYSSEDGAIIWDTDTAQAYKTVNGVPANGGSLDGPGPVVVGGMLFVNSGYAFVGGMPGNVLLAFSVDGR